MKHLTFGAEYISEGVAMMYIADACRANEKRSTFIDKRSRYSTTFVMCLDGTHEAILRNSAGTVVALANVDQYDI